MADDLKGRIAALEELVIQLVIRLPRDEAMALVGAALPPLQGTKEVGATLLPQRIHQRMPRG
jgi:hypothetical protein